MINKLKNIEVKIRIDEIIDADESSDKIKNYITVDLDNHSEGIDICISIDKNDGECILAYLSQFQASCLAEVLLKFANEKHEK